MFFVVGLLAVVAIPDREIGTPQDSQQRKILIDRLERLRTALGRYWGDHDAAYPTLEELQGLSEPAAKHKVRAGFTAYLDRVPDNPFTEDNRIAPMDAPVGDSDWVYDHPTGVFKANDSVEHRSL